MIASWLLKAKILPPKQLVAMQTRHRLIDQLTAGRTRKLTLLEAPAGFGKTTLLAQWRALLLEGQTRVGWLTLDADDTADLLVSYIAFALQEAGIDMAATRILADDRRGSPVGASALHSVLHAVARDGRDVCLMFDDFERDDRCGRTSPARHAAALRARQSAHCRRRAEQSGAAARPPFAERPGQSCRRGKPSFHASRSECLSRRSERASRSVRAHGADEGLARRSADRPRDDGTGARKR
jgi:hypothetical protein